ncbi:DUF7343 domain-containing protein [Haloarchaeobius sp. HRN-SO-5]|uniref:DUF7343 domain-containing protein n=1 Tax=Haloarchaeobius sp. HRN-SO-5 TaxID=3446118 RepID=UPI003EBC8564
MNRRQADAVAGLVVATVLVVGGALSLQAYQQQRALDQMGSMMGTSMGTVHGTNPLWYVLGTLLVAGVVGGLYLAVRDDLTGTPARGRPTTETPGSTDRDVDDAPEGDTPTVDDAPEEPITPEAQPRARVLDLLPDDERRVLEPVLSSPGITQIELRDRSDFSKSKVSQTVSALEKRGLLYRERQGRTYRIYPSDELRQNQGH